MRLRGMPMVNPEPPARTTGTTSRKSARLGPAGEAVRLNIRRIRDAQGISGAELSQRMRNEGRPIPLVGIQRIESGERRVDVDDLMAFAIVLGVTPITLLMPVGVQPDDGLSRYGSTAAAFWEWLRAELPLPSTLQGRPDFAAKALPPWELEKLERRWSLIDLSLIDRVLFGGDDAVREMQRDNEATRRSDVGWQ